MLLPNVLWRKDFVFVHFMVFIKLLSLNAGKQISSNKIYNEQEVWSFIYFKLTQDYIFMLCG